MLNPYNTVLNCTNLIALIDGVVFASLGNPHVRISQDKLSDGRIKHESIDGFSSDRQDPELN